MQKQKFIAKINEEEIEFESFLNENNQWVIRKGDNETAYDIIATDDHSYHIIDEQGRSYPLAFTQKDHEITAFSLGKSLDFELEDYRLHARRILDQKSAGGDENLGVVEIKSQMPGKIVKVKVAEGDEVAKGDGVVVVEAMKMENELASPKDGKVTKVAVSEGDSVESGALLIVVE